MVIGQGGGKPVSAEWVTSGGLHLDGSPWLAVPPSPALNVSRTVTLKFKWGGTSLTLISTDPVATNSVNTYWVDVVISNDASESAQRVWGEFKNFSSLANGSLQARFRSSIKEQRERLRFPTKRPSIPAPVTRRGKRSGKGPRSIRGISISIA
mgnify:CR=1 FL=1